MKHMPEPIGPLIKFMLKPLYNPFLTPSSLKNTRKKYILLPTKIKTNFQNMIELFNIELTLESSSKFHRYFCIDFRQLPLHLLFAFFDELYPKDKQLPDLKIRQYLQKQIFEFH